MSNPIHRRSLLSATALIPVAALPFGGPDPDAELHRLIAEYRRLAAEEEEEAREDYLDIGPDLTSHLAPLIEAFRPQTLPGALAKLRLGFDDWIIERGIEEGFSMDRVGWSGLADLYRVTGITS